MAACGERGSFQKLVGEKNRNEVAGGGVPGVSPGGDSVEIGGSVEIGDSSEIGDSNEPELSLSLLAAAVTGIEPS